MYGAVCRKCRRLTYFVHGRSKPQPGDSFRDYRLTTLSGRQVKLFTPVSIPICRHCESLLRVTDVDYVRPGELGMRSSGTAAFEAVRAQNGRLLEAAGRLLTFVQNVRDAGETSPRLSQQARWILSIVLGEQQRHSEQFDAFHEDEDVAREIVQSEDGETEGEGDGEGDDEVREVEGEGLGSDPVGPDRTDPPIDHRENGSPGWHYPLG